MDTFGAIVNPQKSGLSFRQQTGNPGKKSDLDLAQHEHFTLKRQQRISLLTPGRCNLHCKLDNKIAPLSTAGKAQRTEVSRTAAFSTHPVPKFFTSLVLPGRLCRDEGSELRRHFDFFSRRTLEGLKCSIFQPDLKPNATTLEPHGFLVRNHHPHINDLKFEVSDFERIWKMLKMLSLLISERRVALKS